MAYYIKAMIAISFLTCIVQVGYADEPSMHPSWQTSSCSAVCPTCPARFKAFCNKCHYDKATNTLHAQCEKENNPGTFVTTSCPVRDLDNLPLDKNGQLPCSQAGNQAPAINAEQIILKNRELNGNTQ